MQQQARYLAAQLKPWEGDPTALTMTPSKSMEHDIRPNAHFVYGLATLYTSVGTSYTSQLSRNDCRDKALGLLRFILPTHGAGGKQCNDGKQWHSQWQSALWANTAGRGCWLLWDDLTPEMRWMAARMICDEADRFVDKPPPAQIDNDTKAEENAWDSTVVSLAYCMFPHHPHCEKWRSTAIRWAISSFARKPDLESAAIYDGKSVKEWLTGTGANIHDDFTLENHNRVHPDYMNTIDLCLYQRELYEWAGKPVPQALDFNTTQVYSTLKTLSLPDGGYIYPNGQDWQLHRNPHWVETHIMQAVRFQDPEASRLAANGMDSMERMLARDPNGGVFLPEEFNFPSTQQFTLEMLSLMQHLVGAHGEPAPPVSEEALRKTQVGLHLFRAGKFGLLRTQNSIASFSWSRQVMGMVLPLDTDLLLAPNERNMIGRLQIAGAKDDTPKVESVDAMDSTDTLAVIGMMTRGGAARQHFAFVALPDGRAVYVDSTQLTTSPKLIKADMGLLSVLNDPHWVYSNGKRTLWHEGGSNIFTADGSPTDGAVSLKSKWYNLDDKLGIGVLQSSGAQTYTPNHKMGNGRLEQMFALNSLATGDKATSGAISPTVLVFYPSQHHEKTSQLVARCSCEPVHVDAPFTVTLDDQKRIKIDFPAKLITFQ